MIGKALYVVSKDKEEDVANTSILMSPKPTQTSHSSTNIIYVSSIPHCDFQGRNKSEHLRHKHKDTQATYSKTHQDPTYNFTNKGSRNITTSNPLYCHNLQRCPACGRVCRYQPGRSRQSPEELHMQRIEIKFRIRRLQSCMYEWLGMCLFSLSNSTTVSCRDMKCFGRRTTRVPVSNKLIKIESILKHGFRPDYGICVLADFVCVTLLNVNI